MDGMNFDAPNSIDLRTHTILEQLEREPRELPRLHIAKKPIDELTFEDFSISGYDPDPMIRFAVAV